MRSRAPPLTSKERKKGRKGRRERVCLEQGGMNLNLTRMNGNEPGACPRKTIKIGNRPSVRTTIEKGENV